MHVIHVVSTIDSINFGIWNAAIFASEYLKEKHRISATLWVCDEEKKIDALSVPVRFLGKSQSDHDALNAFAQDDAARDRDTIIVTHGSWLQQTAVGLNLMKQGYRWIYTPHGMLEPWSMSQKKIKKTIYFNLIEKRLASQANAIRAVSAVEKNNLDGIFNRSVTLVENGVQMPLPVTKSGGEQIFLFMARLHHKKGIVPLVKAWNETMQGGGTKLIIAGPDEGELLQIKPLLNPTIEYVGPVYGEKKLDFLRRANYYLLPSFSEGFPTSVVEAMAYGAIPLISAGCNFPAVFSENLGYQIEPDHASIAAILAKLKGLPFDTNLSQRNHEYIATHNSEPAIGEELLRFYKTILSQ